MVDIEDGAVRFRWTDLSARRSAKVMTVSADEFIAAFCGTACPRGFALHPLLRFPRQSLSRQKLAHCRDLLGMPVPEPSESQAPKEYRDRYQELIGWSLRQCPACRQGQMITIETFDGVTGPPPYRDT